MWLIKTGVVPCSLETQDSMMKIDCKKEVRHMMLNYDMYLGEKPGTTSEDCGELTSTEQPEKGSQRKRHIN